MGIILSLLRVSGWKTEEDEDQRSKPRKTSDPLLPLGNQTPKSSDHLIHHPLKQALLISNANAGSQCQNIHVFSGQCLEQKRMSHMQNMRIRESRDQKKPGICISTEKKCEESSKEKEIEGKKVIERKVVVEKPRWIRHYSSRHSILLVGEGDFSFSCSLAVAFGCASKMVATSLDSKAFLDKNYAKAPWNIGELKKRGCIVMHGIDATTIATHQLLQHMTFDRIIYNFPYAGFFKGLSRDSTLRLHRRLVSQFLKNAKEMIDENGEIHISHKTNGYHNEWNLVSIASSRGLRLIEEVEFDLSDYPGYNTKRGFGGDENFDCYPSNTFKFGLKFVGH